jgi:carbon-monoxide dehydrogenase large subunit
VPTYLYATLLAGPTPRPSIYAEVKAVFTNTVPVDAYRGAGRPERPSCSNGSSMAPREMGIDPAELRRKNFIDRRSRTRRRSCCSTTAATTSRRWRGD